MAVTRVAPHRRVARLAGPLHDRLVLYVVIAAVAGVLLPDLAGWMSGAVPLMLAGQVAGVALTLTVGQFVRVTRSPWPVLTALVAQWTLVPAAGLLLARLSGDRVLNDGLIVTAVAPAEITSSLVAILAGGAGAVAVTCMAASLATGTLLTPLWLSAALSGVHVDRGGLVLELALCVTLPLIACVALRTRWEGLAAHSARALDLAAFSVVLVVFVAAGEARDIVPSLRALEAVWLCLALQAMCFVAGALAGLTSGRGRGVRRAVLFPVGMREFGLATALALAVYPPAAAVAGLYGVLLMITGPLLARALRRRAHPGGPAVRNSLLDWLMPRR